jgi:hypothetical protein
MFILNTLNRKLIRYIKYNTFKLNESIYYAIKNILKYKNLNIFQYWIVYARSWRYSIPCYGGVTVAFIVRVCVVGLSQILRTISVFRLLKSNGLRFTEWEQEPFWRTLFVKIIKKNIYTNKVKKNLLAVGVTEREVIFLSMNALFASLFSYIFIWNLKLRFILYGSL